MSQDTASKNDSAASDDPKPGEEFSGHDLAWRYMQRGEAIEASDGDGWAPLAMRGTMMITVSPSGGDPICYDSTRRFRIHQPLTLRSCPFCGGSHIAPMCTPRLTRYYYCVRCGSDGPAEPTWRSAAAAWNGRV